MSNRNKKSKLVVYIDGAARGNPGPAGIGVVIRDEKGNTLKKYKKYLGSRYTNNQAEYLALIHALEICREISTGEITVFSDSELLVRQLNGDYSVRNRRLKKLYERVKQLEKQFAGIAYHHIKREYNKEADLLANQAIDNKMHK